MSGNPQDHQPGLPAIKNAQEFIHSPLKKGSIRAFAPHKTTGEVTMKPATALATAITLAFSAGAAGYGALAIDDNQGSRHGFSYDYPTAYAAQERALQECGAGCTIVNTFETGCAAYAADQAPGSTVYGWGTSTTRADAERIAMDFCWQYGGTQCLIRVWGCHAPVPPAGNRVNPLPY
jgi:hypothetical protein